MVTFEASDKYTSEFVIANSVQSLGTTVASWSVKDRTALGDEEQELGERWLKTAEAHWICP